MLAIVAFALFAVGYILDASGAATRAWDSPLALALAGFALLALHLAGGITNRKP